MTADQLLYLGEVPIDQTYWRALLRIMIIVHVPRFTPIIGQYSALSSKLLSNC
jgi:hypothetical protein